MKPIIGILPNKYEAESIILYQNYIRAVDTAGGAPIILPPPVTDKSFSEFVSICDGFIFTGGSDIHPARYGCETNDTIRNPSAFRDSFELEMFEAIRPTGKPILGICRGCQLINVALGGTLIRDIDSEVETDIVHSNPPTSDYSHSVMITDSAFASVIGSVFITVNSHHHQAVKELGKGLASVANADDGVIEAILSESPFILGVQWHPERLDLKNKQAGERIFEIFIDACKKNKA